MLRKSFLLAAVIACVAGSAWGQAVVSNTYRNLPGGPAVANAPVTFSRIGADGDFTKGITPVVGGKKLPAQVDVLRRAKDGSIRHALVTFVVPSLPGGGEVKVDWLNAAPAKPGAFKWAIAKDKFDLKVVLGKEDGGMITSDVGKIISGAWTASKKVTVLHDGPLMKEFEIIDLPVDAGGAADKWVDVIWRLRVFSGQKSVRVACIVEAAKQHVQGVKYGRGRPRTRQFTGVKVTAGDKVLFQEGGYRHIDQTRYRMLVWTDAVVENIERRPNYEYWVKGKFVPQYRWTNRTKGQYKNMTAEKAEQVFTEQARGRMPRKRKQGILEHGIIYQQMPGTAGRWDIGPYPSWSVAYLLSGGAKTYERILHADGNGSGAFYIHNRQDGMAGHDVFSVKVKPLSQGYRLSRWEIKPTPRWQPDHAHAPSLGYISYLMTGDKFFAEEMSFWAAHHAGEYPYRGLSWRQMARIFAWGLRQVTDAAFILPDGDPLQKYFDGVLVKCFKEMNNKMVKSGKRVHSPMSAGYNGSGRMDWINARRCSVWMYAWAVWSLTNAADKGYAQAKPIRDWAAEYIVGFYANDDKFTAPDGKTYTYDPKDAMPYSTAVSLYKHEIYTSDKGIRRVRLGKKIKDLDNYAEIWYWTKVNSDNMYGQTIGLKTSPNAKGVWPLKANGWGHGMYNWTGKQQRWWAWHRYGAWIGMVAAVEADVPRAQEAWKTMTGMAGPCSYGYEMIPRKNAPKAMKKSK